MNNTDNDGVGQGLPPWMELGRGEWLLRSEVAFWRGLVESCSATVPPESFERMQQALALAESRLVQLYTANGDGLRSCSGPARASEALGASIN